MQFFCTFDTRVRIKRFLISILILLVLISWSILRGQLFFFDGDRILEQLLVRHVLLEWNVLVIALLDSPSRSLFIKLP